MMHRGPKANFLRTNRKNIVPQIARILRRQQRIKQIRQSLSHSKDVIDDMLAHPFQKYSIGKTQDEPVDLRNFCSVYAEDPAVKVS